MTAGDLDDLSGDPARLLGCEEDNRICNVVYGPYSAERNRSKHLCLEFISDIARLHRTRRYSIHSDAEMADLTGDAASERLESGLAGAISDLGREGARRVRADVDDTSARPASGLVAPGFLILLIFAAGKLKARASSQRHVKI